MKLNINAKELLALHNLLYERFESDRGGCKYDEDSDRASSNTQLHQLYNRVKACIVNSLTGKMMDPFDAWSAKEQAKIDALKVELDDVKKDQVELTMHPLTPADLAEGDADFALPDYPRRQRGPGGNRGRNKR